MNFRQYALHTFYHELYMKIFMNLVRKNPSNHYVDVKKIPVIIMDVIILRHTCM